MNIIVYVDKYGKFDSRECNFREIEVCDDDEQNLSTIITRAIENEHEFNQVRVLTIEEYNDLHAKAKAWIEYQAWNKAKAVYKSGRTRFEEENDT